jgi:hypothetical protein
MLRRFSELLQIEREQSSHADSAHRAPRMMPQLRRQSSIRRIQEEVSEAWKFARRTAVPLRQRIESFTSFLSGDFILTGIRDGGDDAPELTAAFENMGIVSALVLYAKVLNAMPLSLLF